MKITLNDLMDALGTDELNFKNSTESTRKVAYSKPTSPIKFVVMTKEESVEKFDPDGDIYCVILEGEQWLAYHFAAVVTNKAGSEDVFTLRRK